MDEMLKVACELQWHVIIVNFLEDPEILPSTVRWEDGMGRHASADPEYRAVGVPECETH